MAMAPNNQSDIKMTAAVTADGDYITIDSVPSGLNPDCLCISCKSPLVAKKGDIYRHHFSHQNNDNHPCDWSPETELHLLTKLYIQNLTKLLVPIGITEPCSELIHLSNIQLETLILDSQYTADVFAELNGEQLYIEILVTHATEKDKLHFYKRNRTNAIEINMSSFFSQFSDLSYTTIAEYLEQNALDHRWLSINPTGDIGERFYAQYATLMKGLSQQYHSESQRLQALKSDIQSATANVSSLQADIEHLQAHPLTQQALSRYDELDKKEYELYRRQQKIHYKEQEINARKKAIDKEHKGLANYLIDRKKAAELEFRAHLESERVKMIQKWQKEASESFSLEINSYRAEMKSLSAERAKLEKDIADMEHTLSSLDSRESQIMEMKKSFHAASIDYANAVRHITLITEEIRPLARKFGMPWPIDHNFIQQLESLGDSNFLKSIAPIAEQSKPK